MNFAGNPGAVHVDILASTSGWIPGETIGKIPGEIPRDILRRILVRIHKRIHGGTPVDILGKCFDEYL